VQSNIDKVLVTIGWELKFPLSSLQSLTRVGSDHCPMILDTGGGQGEQIERLFCLKKIVVPNGRFPEDS
jgi:hypothetical protein